MTRPVVAVTGATGTIGRLVAHGLAADGRADVRLLVRDPGRAVRSGLPGHAVAADLGERPGLVRALAGVESVLAVTADPLRPRHDENLLAAARAAGVRRVVKLSALAVLDPGADDLLTRWQRDNEERLLASGLEWTLLRPRAFMSNTLAWAASVRAEGVVRGLYGSGRNACVDPRDVAAAAVRSLLDPRCSGRSYALSGPEPLSARDQVSHLGEVLGRPLDYVELTEEEALERWRRHWPEPMARALLLSARRQRYGAKATVTDGVREATGRPPGAFADWARAHADVFGAAVTYA
ncbi:nucleotide-diphosphate-sugar epimerase [Streptomyces mashuensis]|uniref:Nucleotide-diphosphate-sugar epimerase n=1 Tax=Streptomyces mashuensis TaxID=33904 RepID=A0A919EGK0_9ACTN|nr:NAD(P)H-binding protein [Streptomyces mashuensis]GHF71943.1 nucleotide-diphosphate-sugar epimerase [Streptomyces mashuensis]